MVASDESDVVPDELSRERVGIDQDGKQENKKDFP
jgi:hypothetical protein